MQSLFDLFISPLQETFFIKALIGGCSVAIVAGVVGCLVILRRMAFLGDALSHAMIAGVAGGYLFMKLVFGIEAHAPGMLIGSLLAAIATVALIGLVSRLSRLKEDTAIGIMYTGIFALGVVAVSIFRNIIHIDLMHFIMGDVLGVADPDLWASVVVAALVLSVILLFFRHFQVTSFDPVMAASIGMPVVLIDYVLTTCVSLVVVSAVSMVGVILVVGLLITPAATAYLLSDRLDRMMVLAAVFGVTSVIGGLYLSIWLDSAGGGAIMLFCTMQFLIVLVVAPRYGLTARWLQLRRMLPQQLVEDVLGTLVRQDHTPKTALVPIIKKHGKTVKAIDTLVDQGLVALTADKVSLTDDGQREARRILRAHRLWEAYLAHLGTPASEIHSRAHELEHVHDTSTIAYIDDLLGHPDADPHGKEIPEDDACRLPDTEVPLSMLRKGRRAVVSQIDPAAAQSDLRIGDTLTISARQDNGRTWVAQKDNGDTLRMDHETADKIMVKCAV